MAGASPPPEKNRHEGKNFPLLLDLLPPPKQNPGYATDCVYIPYSLRLEFTQSARGESIWMAQLASNNLLKLWFTAIVHFILQVQIFFQNAILSNYFWASSFWMFAFCNLNLLRKRSILIKKCFFFLNHLINCNACQLWRDIYRYPKLKRVCNEFEFLTYKSHYIFQCKFVTAFHLTFENWNNTDPALTRLLSYG